MHPLSPILFPSHPSHYQQYTCPPWSQVLVGYTPWDIGMRYCPIVEARSSHNFPSILISTSQGIPCHKYWEGIGQWRILLNRQTKTAHLMEFKTLPAIYIQLDIAASWPSLELFVYPKHAELNSNSLVLYPQSLQRKASLHHNGILTFVPLRHMVKHLLG